MGVEFVWGLGFCGGGGIGLLGWGKNIWGIGERKVMYVLYDILDG